MELEVQLTALQTELKGFVEKANAEKTSHGTMLMETKAAVEAIQKQIDAIDVKLADKHAGGAQEKSIEDQLKENEEVARIIRNKSGRATITFKSSDFERKTTITSAAVGASTSGVLAIDRIPGIVAEARQALTVRDLLVARPTTLQLVDFVKVVTAPSAAGMQTEASDKSQNTVTFASASEKVQTIATWLPATRQVLDDFTELAGYIQSSLPYYVGLEEESQLLSGDGQTVNLHGLITQGAAYNTYLNVLNDNKIDTVGHAISQIAIAKELAPTFVVLNTADWWSIRLTKDSYGRYILGDPQSNVAPSLFGLAVVPTTSITAGSFLVGSGSGAATEIRDRMDTTVEISTEHSDYFVKNLVAIRAEKRLCLVVKRPNSFVHGSF